MLKCMFPGCLNTPNGAGNYCAKHRLFGGSEDKLYEDDNESNEPPIS